MPKNLYSYAKIYIFLKIFNRKVHFCHVHWIPCCLLHPGTLSLPLWPDPFRSYGLSKTFQLGKFLRFARSNLAKQGKNWEWA